jgi:acetate kinase
VDNDPEKNAASPMDSDISLPKAPVRVLIVKSREDWQIARECHELVGKSGGPGNIPSFCHPPTKPKPA